MESLTSLFTSISNFAPRAAWTAFLASGALIFAPASWLELLGVLSFQEDFKGLFGIIFLISAASCFVQTTNIASKKLKKSWDKILYRRVTLHFLKHLTQEEKTCLREFIERDTSTISLPYNHGVAGSLEAKNIIFRSSNVSTHFTSFPYTLQPVAQNLIKQNPHLILAD
ncbi:MAG: hypothetical protein EP318_19375 [Rhodobacteraceae bacterium]|nr:MAG: hypothetical protein EP318_19375 [Paracoccaceae bacterium]